MEQSPGMPVGARDKASEAPTVAPDAALNVLVFQAVISKATLLARKGRYGDAEGLLKDWMARGNENAAAWDLLARIYAQQGLFSEAEAFWKRALELEPGKASCAAGLKRIAQMRSGRLRTDREVALIAVIFIILAALLVGVLARGRIDQVRQSARELYAADDRKLEESQTLLKEREVALAKLQAELTELADQKDLLALRAQDDARAMKQREEEIAALERAVEPKNEEVVRAREEVARAREEADGAAEQVRQARLAVDELRRENSRLVGQNRDLAGRIARIASDQLEEQRVRPLNNNALIRMTLDRSVRIEMRAKVDGLFRESRHRTAKGIAVRHGERRGVLLYFGSTPLGWSAFPNATENVEFVAERDGRVFAFESMAVLDDDPRVVLFTFPAAAELPFEFFDLESGVSRFDDALIARCDGDVYGQCFWQIMGEEGRYYRVPSSPGPGLFRRFSAKPGDVLLSRAGKVLGIMVDRTKALRLTDLETVERMPAFEGRASGEIKQDYARWSSRVTLVTNSGGNR